MIALWERVGWRDGVLAVRTTGTPTAEVVGRLERGDAPAEVALGFGLDATDLVAALAHEALGEAITDGPPLVQGGPKRPSLLGALDEGALAGLYPGVPRPDRLALAAGLLQAFDFWDESHTAAQRADDLGERSVSAYWHGVAHRREPDPGNASYWFRRVGRHPLFPVLGASARGLLADDRALAGRLIPGGSWDPFAFVAFCGAAVGREVATARALQRLEMIVLLDASVPATLCGPR